MAHAALSYDPTRRYDFVARMIERIKSFIAQRLTTPTAMAAGSSR
jgi:hypothetical protein